MTRRLPATTALPLLLAVAMALASGCSDKPAEDADTPRTSSDKPRKARLTLLWTARPTDKDDGFSASPAVSAGKIFLTSENGVACAVSAANGETLWKTKPASGFSASPIEHGGKILIGSLDGTFLSLDSETGETLWKAEVGTKIAGRATVLETEEGTFVFFGAYDKKTHCLDAATGEEKWTFETKGFINGHPVAVGGSVIFGGCDGYLRRHDALTGKTIWSFDAKSHIPASPAVSGNRVFVATHAGNVFAVSLDTGEKIWEFSDGESNPAFFAAPTAAEHAPIIVPSDDGALYALSPATGRLLWKIKLPGVAKTPPLILDEHSAVVVDDSGALSLLSLKDGALLAEKKLGEPFENTPAALDGIIFAASEEGTLFAFNADGSEPTRPLETSGSTSKHTAPGQGKKPAPLP